MYSLIPNSKITKVSFSLSGTEEAIADSSVNIKSHEQFRNNMPYPYGVYDAHLGTTDYKYKCSTCGNNKRKCLGHEGNAQLNYPVISPIAINEIRKWLKVICFRCGRPIVKKEDYIGKAPPARLDEAVKLAANVKKCPDHRCGAPHPTIKKDPNELSASVAEYHENRNIIQKETIYPHVAKEILSRVSDETVVQLGKSISSHPRHYVLDSVKVPSVVIRPDVRKISGGKSMSDDITVVLQHLIRENADPLLTAKEMDVHKEKAIFNLNNTYYELVRAKGGENTTNSLSHRLKGKSGLARKNLLGKRTGNMARSTIVGSPLIKIDELGVPLVFARTNQIEEIANDFNISKLMQYIANGRREYPGATKIIKRTTRETYDVEYKKDSIQLEPGDIVYRDLIDGDPVNFNRQPSLMISNISTHRVKVIMDPSIRTFLMNVIICPFVGGKQAAAMYSYIWKHR